MSICAPVPPRREGVPLCTENPQVVAEFVKQCILNRDHAPHLGSQAVKTSKARLENSTDVDFMRA
jgi:hypothetical protein